MVCGLAWHRMEDVGCHIKSPGGALSSLRCWPGIGRMPQVSCKSGLGSARRARPVNLWGLLGSILQSYAWTYARTVEVSPRCVTSHCNLKGT